MKTRIIKNSFLQITLSAGALALAVLPAHAGIPAKNLLPDDTLAAAFANPPPESRPGIYWFWMNNQVSREGITKELEAMAKAGIGRAYIGIISFRAGVDDKERPALSEPWWDNVRHAIREAGRVGVDIGFFNAPGWSMSGGPWVKPEQSMRYASCSEI
ncbi:MAG: glycosyl hydrolase, partial [bacterium]